MKIVKGILCAAACICIIFVFTGGCLTPSDDNSGSGTISTSCPDGSYKYTTSDGHCCPDGYPYYYGDRCHTQAQSTTGCPSGYYKYTTSDGHCCPEGHPYYYDGGCWSKPGGSTVQTTTYYASCSQCPGSIPLYSYRGGSYEVCNAYYQTCVLSGCGKILDNCR